MVSPAQADPEAVLTRALNGALGVMGEPVRAAIYARLERDFGIGRHELLRDPPLLVQALQSIFGSAYGTIEYLVRRALEAEFGVDVMEGRTLLFVIETLKQKNALSLRR